MTQRHHHHQNIFNILGCRPDIPKLWRIWYIVNGAEMQNRIENCKNCKLSFQYCSISMRNSSKVMYQTWTWTKDRQQNVIQRLTKDDWCLGSSYFLSINNLTLLIWVYYGILWCWEGSSCDGEASDARLLCRIRISHPTPPLWISIRTPGMY